MIVITKIETITTPNNYYEFVYPDIEQYKISFSKGINNLEFTSEIIHGRRYKNDKNGVNLIIGCTKKVTDDLKILLHLVHDNIQEELNISNEKLNKISHYNFWKRLKCVFTGIKEDGE